MSGERRVGIFRGPWESGRTARDGAVIGFADVERAVLAVDGAGSPRLRAMDLDLSLFVRPRMADALAGLDVVYANCGPMAALLFAARAAHGLDFAIVREVRTLGWIGYAFQEFVAHALARENDVCTHTSEFSIALWQSFRGAANDIVHYPLIGPKTGPPLDAATRDAPRPATRARLRCGYLGRIASDKGFAYLPAIVARLREHGWAIASLDACGDPVEAGLLDRCAGALRRAGVTLRYHGALGHARALDLMAGVDLVLFPSVSSFEAAGRVVAEAWALGKPVIAADYCLGRDMVADGFRIPLAPGEPRSGWADDAFPVAALDLDRWTPPAQRAPAFVAGRGDRYRFRPAATLGLLGCDASQPPAFATPAPDGLELHLDWTTFGAGTEHAWCAELRAALGRETRSRADLVDLGGAVKRSLLAIGFRPRVRFSPRAVPAGSA